MSQPGPQPGPQPELEPFEFGGKEYAPMTPSNIMGAIRKGARGQRVVLITYRDAKGTITQRLTEPYEIKDGFYWAYSYLHDGIRKFKIGSVLSAKLNRQTYIPRWPIKIT